MFDALFGPIAHDLGGDEDTVDALDKFCALLPVERWHEQLLGRQPGTPRDCSLCRPTTRLRHQAAERSAAIVLPETMSDLGRTVGASQRIRTLSHLEAGMASRDFYVYLLIDKTASDGPTQGVFYAGKGKAN
ncbi:hypothetical protein ABIA31_007953 [Catenulispora sp. MAP5-51]|uniref:hypothetical protein n=1 Tax=Catenulispora sp. MAP5-51 TaxID=3156298 RepID=UPI00351854AF